MKRIVWIAGLMVLLAGAVRAVEPSDGAERYPIRNSSIPPATANSIRATFTVAPGQSIQAAADRALPGDKIEVLPGTYRESVSIDRDDIELAGIVLDGERPLLQGDGKLNDAVLASGHNFKISGFEIRNYLGNGVVVNKAKNVIFRNLVTHNTGKYAVYPIECDGVLVEGCVSSGVWDAAVYAGQCRNVVIQNCEAYNNTIGIETENSIDVLIANNTAHNNSLGILVVLLPNLPAKLAQNARVINNRVFDNNYPNASPPGNMVNLVEPGVGIAVNAADNTDVTRNIIMGNGSYGVALYSLTDALPNEKLDVEPHPDNTRIHDNEYLKNGEMPESLGKKFKAIGAAGGDLFWSGKGTGNVWKETTDRTYPAQLPQIAGAVAGGQ